MTRRGGGCAGAPGRFREQLLFAPATRGAVQVRGGVRARVECAGRRVCGLPDAARGGGTRVQKHVSACGFRLPVEQQSFGTTCCQVVLVTCAQSTEAALHLHLTVSKTVSKTRNGWPISGFTMAVTSMCMRSGDVQSILKLLIEICKIM